VGNKNSNVAICTSWDDPELVLTEEIIEKVAIAAPMRSTYGVNILLANLALNPQIDKLIFLRGGEFDETETGCLPRKIINNLWKNGIDKKRLSYKGMGAKKMIYPHTHKLQEMQKNRRVEIHIISN